MDGHLPGCQCAQFHAPPLSDCETCAEREKIERQEEYATGDWQKAEVLRRSSEGECQICGAIWTGLKAYAEQVHTGYLIGEIRWNKREQSAPNPLLVDLELVPVDDALLLDYKTKQFFIRLRFYTLEEDYAPDGPAYTFGIGRTVPMASNSSSTLAFMKNWLSNCLEYHPDCQGAPSRQRPGRLVDIASRSYHTGIRLVDSGDEMTSYLALSYCWGKKLSLTTTKGSLQARKHGIDWDDLPKTFQDAIIITRSLGYRFLWIDALCIIQDDPADWSRESAKMASIYQESILTISVAHGEDTAAGCFHARHHWSVAVPLSSSVNTNVGQDLISFKYTSRDDTEPTIYVSRAFEHETLDKDVYAPVSSLFDRAWAFQERLLSTRTIQLTRSEVSWECRTVHDCECGGLDQKLILRPRRDTSSHFYCVVSADMSSNACSLDSPAKPIASGTASPARLRLFEQWRFLVEEYTLRKLSHFSDRLPAFSGIAHQLERPALGNYYAGMWAAELPLALLWHLLVPGDDSPRKVYHAPSWSWASVDGSISFPLLALSEDEIEAQQYYIEAQVDDVHCTPLGLDRMGRVSSGYIVLTAPVFRCCWEVSEQEQDMIAHVNIDGAGWYPLRTAGVETIKKGDAELILYMKSIEEEMSHKIEDFPKTFFFLWILSNGLRGVDPAAHTAAKTMGGRIRGILLRETKSWEKVYERCGFFDIGYPEAHAMTKMELVMQLARVATVKTMRII